MASDYTPWRYADRNVVRRTAAQNFRERAQASDQEREARRQRDAASTYAQAREQAVAPQPAQQKGGKGWLGKIGGALDAVTPDALEGPAKAVGKGALTALDAPRKYVGAPAFGLYEDAPNIANDLIHGDVGKLRPDRLYERGNEKYKQSQEARRNVPGIGRALAFTQDVVADPLTYLGPGAVKGALKWAPEAVQASRGARYLGTVLENPGAATAWATGAGAAGAQLGHAIGGAKGEQIGGLLGSVGGGLVLGHPAGRARIVEGRDKLNEGLAAVQGRPGQAPAMGFGIENVDEGAGLGAAPAAPPAAAPPIAPEALGSSRKPPSGSVDMFRLDTPENVSTRESAYLKGPRGKIEQIARKGATKFGADPNLVKDSDVRPFLVQERNNLNNQIEDYRALNSELMNRVASALKKGGTPIRAVEQDGRVSYLLEGSNLPFGDVVTAALKGADGTPEMAAWQAFTPDARDAIWNWSLFNKDLNANLEHYGHGLNIDPAIQNQYFPNVVVGADGKGRAMMPAGGTRVGSTGPFAHERVYQDIQQGTSAGFDYGDPFKAADLMVAAKLRVAANGRLESILRPLGRSDEEITAAGDRLLHYVPVGNAPGLSGIKFEPGLAGRITDALAPARKGGAAAIPKAVNAALTPARAMADVSAFGQQGAAALFRHPVKAAKGMASVLGSLKDPDRYHSLIDGEAASGPGVQTLVSHGLHWVGEDAGETGLAALGASKGIPVYSKVATWSNQLFGRYMNYVRLMFANDAYERAAKSGLTEGTQQFDNELRKGMQAVNRLSGYTGRKPTSLESIGLFAPRYFSAAVEQTFAAVTKGGMEGSIARAHLGRMAAGGAALVYMTNSARGYETDFDPTSSNFLRIRNVGGLDISPFGTYDTLFRAIAKTSTGDFGALGKLAEGKLSPALSAIYWPARGHTFTGEPLEPLGILHGDVKATGKAIGNQALSMVPFGAQAIAEQGVIPAIQQRSAKPLAEAAPGVAASFVGLSNSPVTPTEKRDFLTSGSPGGVNLPKIGHVDTPSQDRTGLAQQAYGQDYPSLPGAQKSVINEDPRVASLQKEIDKNTLSKTGDRSQYRGKQLEIGGKIDSLSTELESGAITGNEFRDQYRRLQDELRGARSVLDLGDKGGVLDGWFKLYDQAALSDGRTDWTKLDELQSNYRTSHPEVDDAILKAVGAQDNAVLRSYREAQKSAKEYYAIPAYRGLTAEESRSASRTLAAAQDMVSFGQARDMKRALRSMAGDGTITEEEYTAARRASRAKPNRERAAFRQSHPELATFYSDI